MKSVPALCFLLGCACVSLPAAAPAKAQSQTSESRKFTAERVFDLEYGDNPQISPDGSIIIYQRRAMDRYKDRVSSALWTIDVRTGAHRPLIAADTSPSSVRWSPDGSRFVYLASKDGRSDLRIYYRDSGQDFSLATMEQSPSAPVWSPDGKSLAFAMLVPEKAPDFATPPSKPEKAEWAKPMRVFDRLTFRFDGAGYLTRGTRHIFTLPADGGTPRQVTTGENDFADPQWLGNEVLLASGNDVPDAELDPIESEIYRIDLRNLSRTPLTQRDGPDHSPHVSPNGQLIAYIGYDDRLKSYQQSDLYIMHADGSQVRNLTADYDRSIESVSWRPDGKGLIAMTSSQGQMLLLNIDLSGRVSTIASDAGGTTIGRPYGAADFSVAARAGSSKPAIAYTRASTMRPADVAIIRPGGSSRQLTDLNSDVLEHVDLARVEKISVASRHDGRAIDAWVAYPPGFQANGSAPMVLEIHGGPFAMYGAFFAAEIQRYAAEGYVTVYVNPRGSTGYGEEFAQLIDRAYPGHDHDDLMSVVDELVRRGDVSDKRLFITGGSGGGVLSAWAIGQTDRFAAAAVIKPVINWTSMALSADIARFVSRHWLRAQPWEDPELYWRLSPISRVGHVKTPTMVMVGEEDWRTPAWEAEQFYTALKVQNVDAVLVRVPGASHLIAARPSQLIAKVDNIMGWFRKYDPAYQGEDK